MHRSINPRATSVHKSNAAPKDSLDHFLTCHMHESKHQASPGGITSARPIPAHLPRPPRPHGPPPGKRRRPSPPRTASRIPPRGKMVLQCHACSQLTQTIWTYLPYYSCWCSHVIWLCIIGRLLETPTLQQHRHLCHNSVCSYLRRTHRHRTTRLPNLSQNRRLDHGALGGWESRNY